MNWRIKPKAPDSFGKKFSDYHPLLVQLFYNRHLSNRQAVKKFLNPDYQKDLHSPFLLKDIKKAVRRIRQAIERSEKVTVYGDYDADGVCSAAIVFLTLKHLGLSKVDVYIPDRQKENHGLNNKAIRHLAEKGTKLIITVDCASNDREEAALANSLGIDLIVTDHHRVEKKKNPALALINPCRPDDQYPFNELAGAGVAYKLISALLSEKKNESADSFKKWLLDLVALATVADVMPLIDENRTLVKYGLKVLPQTRWLGLQELVKSAKVSLDKPDCYTLGFVLGPRLNAAGRLTQASKAFRLLVTRQREEARQLAEELQRANSQRQNLTNKIVQELIQDLDKQKKLAKLIFKGSPDWPIGLVGLVAGKISDRYNRPTVIYQEKDEMILASARGGRSFNLVKAMQQAAPFLESFGGHKKAAGFQLKKKNLEKVKKIFVRQAEKELKKKDLIPYLEIEAELSLPDINQSTYQLVQDLAPFGPANPEPIFLIKKAEISDLRIVGNNGHHLKMSLIVFDQHSKKAKNFKAIGFNLNQWQDRLKKGDLVDLAFNLIIDHWNGYADLQLKIIDLRLS